MTVKKENVDSEKQSSGSSEFQITVFTKKNKKPNRAFKAQ